MKRQTARRIKAVLPILRDSLRVMQALEGAKTTAE
jgi:hypothetical protein